VLKLVLQIVIWYVYSPVGIPISSFSGGWFLFQGHSCQECCILRSDNVLSIGVGYTIVTGGSIEVELLYNLIDKSIRSGSL
jgi:hypothetical protein